MSEVRVGFVGAGAFANAMHYPDLAEMPDVTIAAICDIDEERLAATANQYGVAARYTDHRRMLAEQDLDAVYVVMPPMGLTPTVLDCFAAGKPVFMEKPPGVTTEETRQMAEAARRSGVFGMVGFNRRYADVVRNARERVLAAGPPSMVMAEFHKNMLHEGPYYGLSILRTDIIHVVDAMRYLADGDSVGVHAYVDRAYAEWPNSFSALVRFDNGAVGILAANRAAGSRYERFELHGRGVSAYIRAPESAEVFTDGVAQPMALTAPHPNPRLSYGYYAEDRHFIHCVRSRQKPLTSLDDAVRTMELVDAIEGRL